MREHDVQADPERHPGARPARRGVRRTESPHARRSGQGRVKIEKHEMGTKLFKQTYAARRTAKATRACIAEAVPVAEVAKTNAAQACNAERDADPAAFNEKYGTSKNKKNAYGKCVSAKAQQATEVAAQDRANAAKTCKALKKDDPAAYEQAYGTKKNALGKCVSATAKTEGA